MKNSKLLSLVLVVIVGLSVALFTKDVFAATTTDFTNIALSSNNTTTGSSTSTTGSGNETVLSSSKNNTTNNTSSNTANSTVLKTNNTTSTYNNSSLPKTGVEDSMPGVILVIVLGVSAVYAYKKMQDYKNI